ncbi:hypothetical protein C8F01DRAFT_1246944 [Mycena amicta]|nr:hypothetical protein C8F01DRAFT_1246944 [Mycena amicta]
MQRAFEWVTEANAYARIRGITLDDREWMYRHKSPSALYIIPSNKLEKIERANKRSRERLAFAQEASLHAPFSPDEQLQVQQRRDARQRQIAHRPGAPLAMKQRYRPDCCEGCGLPTIPKVQCQNPRHRPPSPAFPVDSTGWGSSSGWGSGWGNTEPVRDDGPSSPPVVESNPWWYGDQRMLLVPEDDEISPPGSPGPWKTDTDCLDNGSDGYESQGN